MGRCEPRPLGPLGLRELLEPEIRRLVADRVGIPETWVRDEIAFVDDLALDRTMLTELVIEIERHAGVSIPESAVDGIRTYEDLVDTIVDACAGSKRGPVPSVFLRATVVPGRRDRRGIVARSVWLTPYTRETLTADALRAGPGGRLDITVPASTPLAAAERVDASFAHLASYGVTVAVRHERLSRGRAVA